LLGQHKAGEKTIAGVRESIAKLATLVEDLQAKFAGIKSNIAALNDWFVPAQEMERMQKNFHEHAASLKALEKDAIELITIVIPNTEQHMSKATNTSRTQISAIERAISDLKHDYKDDCRAVQSMVDDHYESMTTKLTSSWEN
jgi:DNA-binding transcriptional regulator YdaS (Cro superfamily)